MQHLCICAESHGFYWGFRPQISSNVQIIGENEWATGAVWWAPIPGYTALITWWPLEGFPVTEGWLWSQWCNLVNSSYVCHCMPIPSCWLWILDGTLSLAPLGAGPKFVSIHPGLRTLRSAGVDADSHAAKGRTVEPHDSMISPW